MFRRALLVIAIIVFNLSFILFYANNQGYNSCNNEILCKLNAQSNQTRDDFPERETVAPIKPPREDLPDLRIDGPSSSDQDNDQDNDQERDQDTDEDKAPRDDFPRDDFPDKDKDGNQDNDQDNDQDSDQDNDQERDQVNDPANNQGGCLIATAAFGSELAPEVQFLREFRDYHVLSTVAGTSFIDAFNSGYYSFSPNVAEYERANPWFKTMIKTSIYPLLGILLAAEKPYLFLPSELGVITSGFIASTLIGIVYFSPFAILLQLYRKRRINLNFGLYAMIMIIALTQLLISLVLNNSTILMITTSVFVLVSLSVAAIMSSSLILKFVPKSKFLIKV